MAILRRHFGKRIYPTKFGFVLMALAGLGLFERGLRGVLSTDPAMPSSMPNLLTGGAILLIVMSDAFQEKALYAAMALRAFGMLLLSVVILQLLLSGDMTETVFLVIAVILLVVVYSVGIARRGDGA